jgi:DNA-binding XRE family transcriptional regulator
MASSLSQKLNQLSKARREKIQARADQLVAEEMSLRDLRLARKLTQEKMAELLQIQQAGVSRLEKRSDLHLSTLRQVVQSMGGELRLVVEFPDRPPVVLTGFEDLDDDR